MIHAHDSPSPGPGLVSAATRLRSGKKDILICMASQNKLETDLLEVERQRDGGGPVTSRSSKPFEESVTCCLGSEAEYFECDVSDITYGFTNHAFLLYPPLNKTQEEWLALCQSLRHVSLPSADSDLGHGDPGRPRGATGSTSRGE